MCLYVWVYENCDVKDEVEFDEDDGDEDIRGRDIFCRTGFVSMSPERANSPASHTGTRVAGQPIKKGMGVHPMRGVRES